MWPSDAVVKLTIFCPATAVSHNLPDPDLLQVWGCPWTPDNCLLRSLHLIQYSHHFRLLRHFVGILSLPAAPPYHQVKSTVRPSPVVLHDISESDFIMVAVSDLILPSHLDVRSERMWGGDSGGTEKSCGCGIFFLCLKGKIMEIFLSLFSLKLWLLQQLS